MHWNYKSARNDDSLGPSIRKGQGSLHQTTKCDILYPNLMFLCRILTRSDRIEFLYMVNIELLVKALHKAIVWCDSRAKETVEALVKETGCRDALRPDCGLPIAEYFSALKIRWLMENEPEIGEKLRNGTALVGTVDSWLVWKMTGRHVTDVTNASRNRVKNSKNIESYSDLWSIS